MPLKWGIITAGHIASKFAGGLQVSKTGQLVATGARDLVRAKEFATKWGGIGYGGYQEVLDDPEVEAVYIATPHHLHAEWTIAAARAGKAILCEKPFTLAHAEALAAITEVKRAGVFFMEAFMYRCSPQLRKAVELLQDGAIGTIRAISAGFSYGARYDLDNFRADDKVGGGGLLDVGSYCASFARLVAGQEPIRADYVANLDRGYDSYGMGALEFENGVIAQIASGIHLPMRNDATVYGESGSLHLDDPWKSSPGSVMTLDRYGKGQETFNLGCSDLELYAYEADAVAEFLDAKECPYMTIDDTLGNMDCLDRLRASCGYQY